MKVLAQTWFSSGRGLVGVVKAQNDEGEMNYYIAPADGFNATIDANNVAAHGALFPWAAGEALFKEVEKC
jgi:hypothetical protein